MKSNKHLSASLFSSLLGGLAILSATPEQPAKASTDVGQINHIIVVYQENWSFDALYGSFPGANGLANAAGAALNQLDRVTGNPISSLAVYDPASNVIPTNNPPVPLNGTLDGRFLVTNGITGDVTAIVNTLQPYDLSAYITPTNLTGDIVHRYWQEQFQIDGGTMDKFVTWSDNPGLVMSHFDATPLPEGQLARQYTMCDNYFHSAFGGSFLNHQFLIAAAPPVYPNAASLIPNSVATLDANGLLALDPTTHRLVRDGSITPIGGVVFANTNLTFDKNYCVNTTFSANLAASGSPTAAALIPSQNDSDPTDLTRPYHLTIGDLLDNAGVSWKWYSGGWDRALNSSPSNPAHYGTTLVDTNISLFQWHHQAFAFFDHYAPWTNGVRNARSAAHIQDETQFFADVSNSTLPSVVFIKPLGPDNEHPGYASLQQGQQHVANIVAAVQANPALWGRTAIIVTYDEHGGRWDHVAPPVRDIWGPGARVPAIIISPLAKTNYVDHTQYDTTAILKTVENRFGLPSLNALDAASPSLVNAFEDAASTNNPVFFAVASGDASTTNAVLWTRCVNPNSPAAVAVTAQVSTDTLFGSHWDFSTSTVVTNDYTAKVVATGLAPGTRYYYRFVEGDGSVASGTGTFKTAPLPTAAVPVSFAFSGDCDGLIRPYALASQVPNKNLDFFMFDGDTEYETSASIGSPAVTSTTTATKAQLFTDFSRKYYQQLVPVNPGGQSCLVPFFAGQGNYTAYDNHELGNKQYINGGAPAGAPISTDTVNLPTGTGFAGKPTDGADTNFSAFAANYMNKSAGFQTLQQVYMNYQPIMERGVINTGVDPRTDGTRQLYFAQSWGKNAILIDTDCRTYRDIRLKLSDGSTDDTGPRADNTNRTMLGKTQLAWLEQTLLSAQQAGTPWKFINISDPIDEIGPIGGALATSGVPTVADFGTLGTITSVNTTAANSGKTITVASTVGLQVNQPVSGSGIAAGSKIATVNTDGTTFVLNNTPTSTVASGTALTLSPAATTYAPVSSDGGKSWIGGYRAERNALLKFIADNHILNVVFLATDDHQNRINELTYSPTSDTANQSSYVKVPYCFEIVCGPLGATGPDLIQNHTFALAKKLADYVATNEIAAGVEPIGLVGYPGLHNVARLGDATAGVNPQPVDFYSPDTFNYNKLDVSADGKTLTVTSYGINSTLQNAFTEYDAANNPEKQIFSFQVDAASDFAGLNHIIVVYQENWSFDALYGSFPGANGLANAAGAALNQLDRVTGNPISSLAIYDPASNVIPTNNPPVPLNGTLDSRFLVTNGITGDVTAIVNTLQPYDLSAYITPTNLTGDIVHRYWQEQFQIDGGTMDKFVTWSDNPGLVMSHFDATPLPEGQLARQYTMCDNYFHSAFGGSFLNHQFLIAAAPPVYPNAASLIPNSVATLDANGLLALDPTTHRLVRDGSITPHRWRSLRQHEPDL